MQPEEARPRLAALGFAPADVETLAAHFLDAERRGQRGHGLSRIEWLETWDELPVDARRRACVTDEPGYERWDGGGALGYLTLAAVVEAQLADTAGARPRRRLLAARSRPARSATGCGKLADGGLVALLTATSPRRLAAARRRAAARRHEPARDRRARRATGEPVVADVSMGAVTYGEVLAGRARPEELVPFGGELAHKAFALAIGLQLVVDALVPTEGFGAVLVVAQPEADPVPALRALAAGRTPAGRPPLRG